jgi:hypothetical protein
MMVRSLHAAMKDSTSFGKFTFNFLNKYLVNLNKAESKPVSNPNLATLGNVFLY